MGTTEVRSDEASEGGDVGTADMKIEVVVIPASDADRAKRRGGEFNAQLARQDHERGPHRAPSTSNAQTTG